MELFGRNLSSLVKKQPKHAFSQVTTALIGLQSLEALELLHSKGYLHCDVKPSNFVIGRNSHRSTLYLIDFGLSRRFFPIDEQCNIASRGFRGTARYASVSMHQGCEQGRVDDLWSWLYMLVDLGTGTVPWHNIQDKVCYFSPVMSQEVIMQTKKASHASKLLEHMPIEYQDILLLLSSLTCYDQPNYSFLKSALLSVLESHSSLDTASFDWNPTETVYPSLWNVLNNNATALAQKNMRDLLLTDRQHSFDLDFVQSSTDTANDNDNSVQEQKEQGTRSPSPQSPKYPTPTHSSVLPTSEQEKSPGQCSGVPEPSRQFNRPERKTCDPPCFSMAPSARPESSTFRARSNTTGAHYSPPISPVDPNIDRPRVWTPRLPPRPLLRQPSIPEIRDIDDVGEKVRIPEQHSPTRLEEPWAPLFQTLHSHPSPISVASLPRTPGDTGTFSSQLLTPTLSQLSHIQHNTPQLPMGSLFHPPSLQSIAQLNSADLSMLCQDSKFSARVSERGEGSISSGQTILGTPGKNGLLPQVFACGSSILGTPLQHSSSFALFDGAKSEKTPPDLGMEPLFGQASAKLSSMHTSASASFLSPLSHSSQTPHSPRYNPNPTETPFSMNYNTTLGGLNATPSLLISARSHRHQNSFDIEPEPPNPSHQRTASQPVFPQTKLTIKHQRTPTSLSPRADSMPFFVSMPPNHRSKPYHSSFMSNSAAGSSNILLTAHSSAVSPVVNPTSNSFPFVPIEPNSSETFREARIVPLSGEFNPTHNQQTRVAASSLEYHEVALDQATPLPSPTARECDCVLF
ncbi:putative Tau-tubulin kinase [Blattamonas nauphoetae]|uniref:non-specific serine/threonine protein kinase n=1 Tax=Blattamonas nauphoetae TaxID=2049346 RepID=A0ABQ9XJ81_9EUKA|nr:putative Tau-tubulin kinase [Blattamonas nauphoetae]